MDSNGNKVPITEKAKSALISGDFVEVSIFRPHSRCDLEMQDQLPKYIHGVKKNFHILVTTTLSKIKY